MDAHQRLVADVDARGRATRLLRQDGNGRIYYTFTRWQVPIATDSGGGATAPPCRRQGDRLSLIHICRRFHDMRRWKIAHTEMMRYQKSWTLSGKTADSFYKLTNMKETGVRNFTAPKNYWLAIPQDQIEVNPNLVQNPGY